MVARQNLLIQLREAFTRILTRLEENDRVAPGWRLTVPRPRGGENTFGIRAAGPEFTSYRLDVPVPVRWPTWKEPLDRFWYVPEVPNQAQLTCLLADCLATPQATTDAERRACEAHKIIGDAVATKLIKVFGDLVLHERPRKQPVLVARRQPVSAKIWTDFDVDYAASTLFERSLAPTRTRVDGLEVSGSRSFDRVVIDELEFDELLRNIRTQRRPPEITNSINASLSMHSDSSEERWLITWSNVELTVSVKVKNGEVLRRGMRTLAVLLRNPTTPISTLILSGLTRKRKNDGTWFHGPSKSELSNSERGALYDAIDPIARDLLAGAVSVSEAHVALQVALSGPRIIFDYRPKGKERWVSCNGGLLTVRPRRAANVDRMTNIVEEVRKGLNRALDELQMKEGGREVALFLRKSCKIDHDVGYYRSPDLNVRWCIQT